MSRNLQHELQTPRHLRDNGIDDLPGDGSNVSIALFDSGVDIREGAARRQLKYRSRPARIEGRDFTSSQHHYPFVDEYGHGTKMASILCAGTSEDKLAWNRCQGVAPKAALVNCKIAGRDGMVLVDGLLRAAKALPEIRRSESLPPFKVALLALDWELWRSGKDKEYEDKLHETLDTLVEAQVLPVLAAGDQPIGTDLDEEKMLWEPFRESILIVAGALPTPSAGETERLGSEDCCSGTERPGSTGLLMSSNFGSKAVDLAAPGEAIPALTPMAAGLAFGTSAAAAIVAGAAARLASDDSSLQAADLRRKILESTKTLEAPPEGMRFLDFRATER